MHYLITQSIEPKLIKTTPKTTKIAPQIVFFVTISNSFKNKRDNPIATNGFTAIIGVTRTTGAFDRARYQQETPNAEAQPAPNIYKYPDIGDMDRLDTEFFPNMTPVISNPNKSENPDTIIGEAYSVVIIFPKTAIKP